MKIENINNIAVAVECDWEITEAGNMNAIKRRLKNEILSKEVDSFNAAILQSNRKGKVSYTKNTKDRRLEKEKVIPLAAYFIFDFKSTVIVKKIKDYKENGVNHTEYWVCAIDSSGLILEDVVLNEDYVDGKVSEYLEIDYTLATYKNDYHPLSNNINIDKIFDEEVFDIDEVDFENLSFNNYKKEDYRKYYQIGFLSILVFAGVFLFFSFYETGDKTKIIRTDYTAPIANEKRRVDNWIANNQSNGGEVSGVNYTQEEAIDLAKKQIQSEFNERLYTNINIINNIVDIESSMPRYLVEWQMGNILYMDNQFFTMYNKISGSNGVFTELDMILKRYSDYTAFDITPLSLSPEADIRTISLDFSNKIETTFDDSGKTLFEMREEQEKKIDEIINEINLSIRAIDRFKKEAREVNTFKQFFTNNLNRIESQILLEVSKLNNLYAEAIEEIEVEFSSFELDFEISSRTVEKYIEMSHLNTVFNWSMPEETLQYPRIENLPVDYYATAYSVEVSSIENLSDNFELFVDATNELTNINSIVKRVEYNIIDGSWIIEAVIYQKNN